MKIMGFIKRPLKDYILYCLMGYAFASAISITMAEFFFLAGLILWIVDTIKNKISLKEQFKSPISLALLVFLVLHLVSAVFGIDAVTSLKDFKKTYIILLYFLAANYLGGEKDIKKVIVSFITGACVVGIYAVVTTAYQKFALGNMDFRASSFSGNHMHAGGMLMMACIVSAGALAYKIKTDLKDARGAALLAAAFLIISAGLLCTYTRGSWLAAFLGVILVVGYADKRLLAAVLVLSVIAAFALRGTSVMDRIESSVRVKPDTNSSANERILMWKSGLLIVKERPLIGIGTANLDKIYPRYRQPGTFEMNQGHLHNNIIQLAVIDGIPGMLAFLWIFGAMWFSFVRGLAMNRSGAAGSRLKAVFFSLFCVSIAFFINGFFEYNFFSAQPALMFWFLTGTGWGILKAGERVSGNGKRRAGKRGTGNVKTKRKTEKKG